MSRHAQVGGAGARGLRGALALGLVLGSLLGASRAGAAPKTWKVNPANSAAHLTVKHLMITPVLGTLGQVEGEVSYDDADPSACHIEVRIPTAGLHTGHPPRDEALAGPSFLDAEAHPTIRFESTKAEPNGNGLLVVSGELTVRGVTRPVVFEMNGPTRTVINAEGVPTRALVGRTRLDRKDFGVTWNMALDSGGMLAGDEVAVELVLELVEPRPRSEPAK